MTDLLYTITFGEGWRYGYPLPYASESAVHFFT